MVSAASSVAPEGLVGDLSCSLLGKRHLFVRRVWGTGRGAGLQGRSMAGLGDSEQQ